MSDTEITFTGAYTCTNHNDRQRVECPVCLVASLTTERDQLRDKVKSLKKQIKDDNFSYGCELRDPYGTIWEQATKDHARAERAEAAETVALAQWNGALERAMKAEAEAHQWKASHDNQVKLKSIIMSRADLGDRAPRVVAMMAEVDAANARAERAEAELATEREKVRVLRSSLENLCDEQNGAPLETHRDQWQLVMDEARAAIVATEDAK
jgi:hypothetical protein